MTPAADILPSRRQLAWLAALLFLVDLISALFKIFDWDHGLARMVILAGLGAGLIALRLKPLPLKPGAEPGAGLHKTIYAAFVALIALYAILVGVTLYHTAATGEIRLDQGQNLYRADLALLQGENPYGRGEMLDIEAYVLR